MPKRVLVWEEDRADEQRVAEIANAILAANPHLGAEEARRSAIDLVAYLDELPDLLAAGQEGRFALVGGGIFFGVWDSFEEACTDGYSVFPDGRFLAQKITKAGLRPEAVPECVREPALMLQAAATALAKGFGEALQAAQQAGKLLLQAKAQVPGEQWPRLVALHARIGSHDAELYQCVAERWRVVAERWRQMNRQEQQTLFLAGWRRCLRLLVQEVPGEATAEGLAAWLQWARRVGPTVSDR